jgi:hypothetical protein
MAHLRKNRRQGSMLAEDQSVGEGQALLPLDNNLCSHAVKLPSSSSPGFFHRAQQEPRTLGRVGAKLDQMLYAARASPSNRCIITPT